MEHGDHQTVTEVRMLYRTQPELLAFVMSEMHGAIHDKKDRRSRL